MSLKRHRALSLLFASFALKNFLLLSLWGRPMTSEHFSMLHPHFTPDITLGIATVGGGVLGGYLSLRSDLELQRAEFRVALAGHEARLTVTERLIEERRTDDRQFQAEMRASLDRVMQAISDLKAGLVRKQDRK